MPGIALQEAGGMCGLHVYVPVSWPGLTAAAGCCSIDRPMVQHEGFTAALPVL
jgi:hypothetical protein